MIYIDSFRVGWANRILTIASQHGLECGQVEAISHIMTPTYKDAKRSLLASSDRIGWVSQCKDRTQGSLVRLRVSVDQYNNANVQWKLMRDIRLTPSWNIAGWSRGDEASVGWSELEWIQNFRQNWSLPGIRSPSPPVPSQKTKRRFGGIVEGGWDLTRDLKTTGTGEGKISSLCLSN